MCAALPLQETQKENKLCHGIIYRFVPEKYRYTEKRQTLKKESEKGSGGREGARGGAKGREKYSKFTCCVRCFAL